MALTASANGFQSPMIRAIHWGLVLGFLAALLTGGRVRAIHVPAGLLAGILASGHIAMVVAKSFGTRRNREAETSLERRGRDIGIALLVCLAGLAFSGLSVLVSGPDLAGIGPAAGPEKPGLSWQDVHAGFRYAALVLFALHIGLAAAGPLLSPASASVPANAARDPVGAEGGSDSAEPGVSR